MAKSSAGFTEGEIREGLLCPICMYDLHTVDQLQEHFDVNHSTEDTDVIQALKGFFAPSSTHDDSKQHQCHHEAIFYGTKQFSSTRKVFH
ncbi:hypothetical protein AVEN_230313-1 [Araneus ventricosus]|uniref:C2H2-type domain-containing protein n=1 Tax=Araneus ventricosus TaxID=182803 RepID=A0A4Y2TA29_ARAVE|nr:hypothetical protein AVEN_112347-1 [Araneus ventricosus]GBN97498.1 hypothetical protein AVEN_230313-1 [Araneus ventricosus]